MSSLSIKYIDDELLKISVLKIKILIIEEQFISQFFPNKKEYF